MADYGPQQRVRLLGGSQCCYVLARQEPGLQFGDPVPGDREAYPLPCQLRLERRLVELRVGEGGEGCGPALHGREEALLDYDAIRDVTKPGLPGKV